MSTSNDYRTDSGSNCPDIRAKFIGATDAAVICDVSPWKSKKDLWIEKTMPLDAWKGNAATDTGISLEKPILDMAERELGKLARNVRIEAQNVDFPLCSQIDGLTTTNEPVEAKTSGITGPLYGSWGDALTDQVPDYYLVQCQVQLFCTGAELCYLFALLGGRGFVRYEIPANVQVQEMIVERCRNWWHRHVVEGIEPDDRDPPSLEIVKRIRRQPNKTVELTESQARMLEELELYKGMEKTAKAQVEKSQADLILSLGDAEAGILPDGRQVTYFETSRKGYTVEPTTYRTLRVKKA